MRLLAFALLLASGSAAAAPSVHVSYDAEHLDLDKHVLQFKPSRAVSEATLTVIDDAGNDLGDAHVEYDKLPANGWLAIAWTPSSDAPVMKLELEVKTADGAGTRVELIPWSATIDHDDVEFRTDSSTIDDGERAKVDASAAKIVEIVQRVGKHMKLTLYVAGHTDTVGPSDKNRKLSLDRAIAIGHYLAAHGVAVPIVVAGFGESVPKVATPDNTDEPANRRADYVLGPAGGTPPFHGAYLKAKAQWRALR